MRMAYCLCVLLLLSTAAHAQTPVCGVRVTPGVGTFTFAGATYRIDTTRKILRNDVALGNGLGSVLVVADGVLQTLGTDGNWYQWGTVWSQTNKPDPCPPAPVVVGTVTRLGWDQGAASQAAAQAQAYRFYKDEGAVGVPLTGVVCTAPVATSPAGTFPCSVAMPSELAGVSHSVRLTSGDGGGESPKSAALGYVYVAVGSATNVRLK